jgi:hypothetical protein
MDRRCDHGDGSTEARKIDVDRATRLVAATLADDETETVITRCEMDDCPDCLRGVIKALTGTVATLMLERRLRSAPMD